MVDYSQYKPSTNQHIVNQFIYGQLYYSKKWYVRPTNWAGIGKRVDDKIYLVIGNIEKQFDTEQECVDYIRSRGVKNEK